MDGLELKEKFVKWYVPLIFMSRKCITFPFGTVHYDPEYAYIVNDKDYKFLKRKMKNLLKMVNNDPKLGFVDIETDLWYKI